MNPPTAVRPPRPGNARARARRVGPLHLLVAVAAIATALLAERIFDSPTRIDRITFENPTDYDLRVEVSGEQRDRWSALATAPARQAKEVGEILDVGEVWVFRFSSQGKDGGELRISRTELAGDGWRVEIPRRVGARLRTLGAPPPP